MTKNCNCLWENCNNLPSTFFNPRRHCTPTNWHDYDSTTTKFTKTLWLGRYLISALTSLVITGKCVFS